MGIEDFVASQINAGIADHIKQAHVDPLHTMFKGSQPLGEIGPVSGTITYSVGNVTGLSSLAVEPKIHLGELDWSKLIEGNHPPIDGSFSASGKFKSIAAKIHGGVEASRHRPLPGWLNFFFSLFSGSPRIDLDGAVSIDGLGATMEGTLTVTGEGSLTRGVKVCVTALEIQKLGLTHDGIHIKLQEHAEFGHLLDRAVGVIDKHVAHVIEDGLDSVLKTAVNAGIGKVLPFCKEFHPADAVEEAGKGLLKWLGL